MTKRKHADDNLSEDEEPLPHRKLQDVEPSSTGAYGSRAVASPGISDRQGQKCSGSAMADEGGTSHKPTPPQASSPSILSRSATRATMPAADAIADRKPQASATLNDVTMEMLAPVTRHNDDAGEDWDLLRAASKRWFPCPIRIAFDSNPPRPASIWGGHNAQASCMFLRCLCPQCKQEELRSGNQTNVKPFHEFYEHCKGSCYELDDADELGWLDKYGDAFIIKSGVQREYRNGSFRQWMIQESIQMGADQLVGVQLHVYWYAQEAEEPGKFGVWFSGTIVDFNKTTGWVEIEYADGEREKLFLPCSFIHFGPEPPLANEPINRLSPVGVNARSTPPPDTLSSEGPGVASAQPASATHVNASGKASAKLAGGPLSGQANENSGLVGGKAKKRRRLIATSELSGELIAADTSPCPLDLEDAVQDQSTVPPADTSPAGMLPVHAAPQSSTAVPTAGTIVAIAEQASNGVGSVHAAPAKSATLPACMDMQGVATATEPSGQESQGPCVVCAAVPHIELPHSEYDTPLQATACSTLQLQEPSGMDAHANVVPFEPSARVPAVAPSHNSTGMCPDEGKRPSSDQPSLTHGCKQVPAHNCPTDDSPHPPAATASRTGNHDETSREAVQIASIADGQIGTQIRMSPNHQAAAFKSGKISPACSSPPKQVSAPSSAAGSLVATACRKQASMADTTPSTTYASQHRQQHTQNTSSVAGQQGLVLVRASSPETFCKGQHGQRAHLSPAPDRTARAGKQASMCAPNHTIGQPCAASPQDAAGQDPSSNSKQGRAATFAVHSYNQQAEHTSTSPQGQPDSHALQVASRQEHAPTEAGGCSLKPGGMGPSSLRDASGGHSADRRPPLNKGWAKLQQTLLVQGTASGARPSQPFQTILASLPQSTNSSVLQNAKLVLHGCQLEQVKGPAAASASHQKSLSDSSARGKHAPVASQQIDLSDDKQSLFEQKRVLQQKAPQTGSRLGVDKTESCQMNLGDLTELNQATEAHSGQAKAAHSSRSPVTEPRTPAAAQHATPLLSQPPIPVVAHASPSSIAPAPDTDTTYATPQQDATTGVASQHKQPPSSAEIFGTHASTYSSKPSVGSASAASAQAGGRSAALPASLTSPPGQKRLTGSTHTSSTRSTWSKRLGMGQSKPATIPSSLVRSKHASGSQGVHAGLQEGGSSRVSPIGRSQTGDLRSGSVVVRRTALASGPASTPDPSSSRGIPAPNQQHSAGGRIAGEKTIAAAAPREGCQTMPGLSAIGTARRANHVGSGTSSAKAVDPEARPDQMTLPSSTTVQPVTEQKPSTMGTSPTAVARVVLSDAQHAAAATTAVHPAASGPVGAPGVALPSVALAPPITANMPTAPTSTVTPDMSATAHTTTIAVAADMPAAPSSTDAPGMLTTAHTTTADMPTVPSSTVAPNILATAHMLPTASAANTTRLPISSVVPGPTVIATVDRAPAPPTSSMAPTPAAATVETALPAATDGTATAPILGPASISAGQSSELLSAVDSPQTVAGPSATRLHYLTSASAAGLTGALSASDAPSPVLSTFTGTVGLPTQMCIPTAAVDPTMSVLPVMFSTPMGPELVYSTSEVIAPGILSLQPATCTSPPLPTLVTQAVSEQTPVVEQADALALPSVSLYAIGCSGHSHGHGHRHAGLQVTRQADTESWEHGFAADLEQQLEQANTAQAVPAALTMPSGLTLPVTRAFTLAPQEHMVGMMSYGSQLAVGWGAHGQRPAEPPDPARAATALDKLKKYLEERGGTLPNGWTYLRKKRTSGQTAGHMDAYYVSPAGKKIPSRRQVARELGLPLDPIPQNQCTGTQAVKRSCTGQQAQTAMATAHSRRQAAALSADRYAASMHSMPTRAPVTLPAAQAVGSTLPRKAAVHGSAATGLSPEPGLSHHMLLALAPASAGASMTQQAAVELPSAASTAAASVDLNTTTVRSAVEAAVAPTHVVAAAAVTIMPIPPAAGAGSGGAADAAQPAASTGQPGGGDQPLQIVKPEPESTSTASSLQAAAHVATQVLIEPEDVAGAPPASTAVNEPATETAPAAAMAVEGGQTGSIGNAAVEPLVVPGTNTPAAHTAMQVAELTADTEQPETSAAEQPAAPMEAAAAAGPATTPHGSDSAAAAAPSPQAQLPEAVSLSSQVARLVHDLESVCQNLQLAAMGVNLEPQFVQLRGLAREVLECAHRRAQQGGPLPTVAEALEVAAKVFGLEEVLQIVLTTVAQLPVVNQHIRGGRPQGSKMTVTANPHSTLQPGGLQGILTGLPTSQYPVAHLAPQQGATQRPVPVNTTSMAAGNARLFKEMLSKLDRELMQARKTGIVTAQAAQCYMNLSQMADPACLRQLRHRIAHLLPSSHLRRMMRQELGRVNKQAALSRHMAAQQGSRAHPTMLPAHAAPPNLDAHVGAHASHGLSSSSSPNGMQLEPWPILGLRNPSMCGTGHKSVRSQAMATDGSPTLRTGQLRAATASGRAGTACEQDLVRQGSPVLQQPRLLPGLPILLPAGTSSPPNPLRQASPPAATELNQADWDLDSILIGMDLMPVQSTTQFPSQQATHGSSNTMHSSMIPLADLQVPTLPSSQPLTCAPSLFTSRSSPPSNFSTPMPGNFMPVSMQQPSSFPIRSTPSSRGADMHASNYGSRGQAQLSHLAAMPVHMGVSSNYNTISLHSTAEQQPCAARQLTLDPITQRYMQEVQQQHVEKSLAPLPNEELLRLAQQTRQQQPSQHPQQLQQQQPSQQQQSRQPLQDRPTHLQPGTNPMQPGFSAWIPMMPTSMALPFNPLAPFNLPMPPQQLFPRYDAGPVVSVISPGPAGMASPLGIIAPEAGATVPSMLPSMGSAIHHAAPENASLSGNLVPVDSAIGVSAPQTRSASPSGTGALPQQLLQADVPASMDSLSRMKPEALFLHIQCALPAFKLEGGPGDEIELKSKLRDAWRRQRDVQEVQEQLNANCILVMDALVMGNLPLLKEVLQHFVGDVASRITACNWEDPSLLSLTATFKPQLHLTMEQLAAQAVAFRNICTSATPMDMLLALLQCMNLAGMDSASKLTIAQLLTATQDLDFLRFECACMLDLVNPDMDPAMLRDEIAKSFLTRS